MGQYRLATTAMSLLLLLAACAQPGPGPGPGGTETPEDPAAIRLQAESGTDGTSPAGSAEPLVTAAPGSLSSNAFIVVDMAAAGEQGVVLPRSNAAVRFSIPPEVGAGTYRVRLLARGTNEGGWPVVGLRRAGTQVATREVDTTTYGLRTFGQLTLEPGDTLDLVHTNGPASGAGSTRDPVVDYLVLEPVGDPAATPDGIAIDHSGLLAGAVALADASANGGQAARLPVAGARANFTVPTNLAPGAYVVQVRGRGEPVQGWPEIELVDGSTQLASAPLDSSTMRIRTVGTFNLRPGGTIGVRLKNVSLPSGETRRRAAVVDQLVLVSASTGSNPNVPVPTTTQPVRFNFQPAAASAPANYLKETGAPYSAARGYGWIREDSIGSASPVPVSVENGTRDRDRAGVDQRLDTIAHMQLAGSPAAAWEFLVPNGRYAVTLSVGDQPEYNSQHTVNVEGVPAISGFVSTTASEYRIATVIVTVSDRLLTVDAKGGTNTKLNWLEVVEVPPGTHPAVIASSPDDTERNVQRNAAVIMDLRLPVSGAGVDARTLTNPNVSVYETRTGSLVAGEYNTSGGGDSIVFQPKALLKASTSYTFRLTTGVRDQSGASFVPYSMSFETGILPEFTEPLFTTTEVYNGMPLSSLTIGPDGRLYGAALDGSISRWTIDAGGTLSGIETLRLPELEGRSIIGLVFDPASTSADLTLWITSNDALFPQPAADFTGRISRLLISAFPAATAGTFEATLQPYVVGLPRSAKDHLSNSLAFGPDGFLYLTQGSNTAMGAPDNAWSNRPERRLSAAVLRINPGVNVTAGPINATTPDGGGAYDPAAAGAPVTLFATGVRNAYDLVWHTNGSLYVPANGSAAGGSTPAGGGAPGLTNVATQNDYLYRVVQGGYYGHPNSVRNEFVLNGGNPTSGRDLAEVAPREPFSGYPVGVQPDPNYRGFAWDFGRNRSPNGAIEYRNAVAHGGALAGKLLVVEYSAGDDILALDVSGGDVPSNSPGAVRIVFTGLINPLDLIEDPTTGNLYVAELSGGFTPTPSGRISLLKPRP